VEFEERNGVSERRKQTEDRGLKKFGSDSRKTEIKK